MELEREIRMALRSQKFGAIIFDIPWYLEKEGNSDVWANKVFSGDETPWLMDEVIKSYELSGKLFLEKTVFWPVTGLKTRPQQIYLVKEKEPRE